MKTILVDDEPVMLRSFLRQSQGIEALEMVGQFQFPEEAEAYAAEHPVELAILDIQMPKLNGIELARRLRERNPEILIVFISAYDDYLPETNEIDADYFIVKPYTREMLLNMARRMELLSVRQGKEIYLQMFGCFTVFHRGKPVMLSGKAKEILALAASRRGREISNEEIYSTLWENREYNNVQMKVYYNALKRLRSALEKEGIPALLISTRRGQLLNTALVDCDYYAWQDRRGDGKSRFEGEFLTEYSWGEAVLANILNTRNDG